MCFSKQPSKEKENSSAKAFMKLLMSEGEETICDSTSPAFKRDLIPDFYDKEKFRKAKEFYHRNIFALFVVKLLGLITLLAWNVATDILMMTNKSSTPYSAYIRYMRTIYHMHSWYNEDFIPGSKSFQSLLQVKQIHNRVSHLCHSKGMKRTSQSEMTTTLFGFVGFAVIRPEKMGLTQATRQDLEAFIHFWRVIGYSLGIDDQFNPCKDSLEETKAIFEEMLRIRFKPGLLNQSHDFLNMSDAFVNGMRRLEPILTSNAVRAFLLEVALDSKNNLFKEYFTKNDKISYDVLKQIISWQKYTIIRIICVGIIRSQLFILKIYSLFYSKNVNLVPTCLR